VSDSQSAAFEVGLGSPCARTGRRSSPAAVASCLAELAELGAYFTVTTGEPPPGHWRPVRDLHARPAALAAVVAHVGARLGTTEYGVAASTLFLGYAARLWSVTLGAAVRTGILLDLDGLHWRDTDGRLDLHLHRPTGRVDAEPAGSAREMVLDRHLAPLIAAVRAVEPMSEQLLWGNAASALIGTARLLDGESGSTAGQLAETMLRDPRLAATVDREGAGYRRRSCCLFYRTPASGYCGDCALTRPHHPARDVG